MHVTFDLLATGNCHLAGESCLFRYTWKLPRVPVDLAVTRCCLNHITNCLVRQTDLQDLMLAVLSACHELSTLGHVCVLQECCSCCEPTTRCEMHPHCWQHRPSGCTTGSGIFLRTVLAARRRARLACAAGLGDPYFDLAVRQVDATRRHFCAGRPYSAHYFVFTDRDASAAADAPDLTFVRKVPQGWPRDSDDRYSWFIEVRDTASGHAQRRGHSIQFPHGAVHVSQHHSSRGQGLDPFD